MKLARTDVKKSPEPPKLLYNKAEAAVMLSLSLRTIDTLIAEKELAIRRVRRRVLIPYSALMDFIRRDHLGEEEAA